MSLIDNIHLCDGCGVEIVGAPVYVNQKYFCCQDCADGRECDCGNKPDGGEDIRATKKRVSVMGRDIGSC
jgi:hypothetical protein